MKTKNYLPPLAYRIGALGSVLQVGIAIAIAATTDPAYRMSHLSMAALHLGFTVFWLHQYGQAKRFVPTKPTKLMSVAAAQRLLGFSVLLALGFEVMMLWLGYQSFQLGSRVDNPRILLGTMLSILSMQIMPLMSGGIMIVVARQQLNQAKAAALEVQEVQEEVAPTRTGWWTQDETRQELRRK